MGTAGLLATDPKKVVVSTAIRMAPDRYVYRTKNLRRLRVPKHAQCEFLEGGGCRVHAAKPMQCRSFPYWPELIDDRKAWHKTGSWCPGIGKGELVNIEAARGMAEEMRVAHPHLYRP